jgi:hypothetical protein
MGRGFAEVPAWSHWVLTHIRTGLVLWLSKLAEQPVSNVYICMLGQQLRVRFYDSCAVP